MTSTLADNPYAEGTIYYSSWGYNQTNIDYYEITRETAATVVLTRIASCIIDGRVYPVPGEYLVRRDGSRCEKRCRKSAGYRGTPWLKITSGNYPLTVGMGGG